MFTIPLSKAHAVSSNCEFFLAFAAFFSSIRFKASSRCCSFRLVCSRVTPRDLGDMAFLSFWLFVLLCCVCIIRVWQGCKHAVQIMQINAVTTKNKFRRSRNKRGPWSRPRQTGPQGGALGPQMMSVSILFRWIAFTYHRPDTWFNVVGQVLIQTRLLDAVCEVSRLDARSRPVEPRMSLSYGLVFSMSSPCIGTPDPRTC